MIDLKLTREEYRKLLDLVAISDWVMHAFETKESEETKPYRELTQKILSLAGQAKVENLIEFSPESQQYFPTAKFDESSQYYDFLDAFVDDVFWDELTERFVQRDLIKILGRVKYHELSIRERFEKEAPIRNRYENHFAREGILNLQIVPAEEV